MPALQDATHALIWGSPKSHLPPELRGLVCRRRISASVPPTIPGDRPTSTPRAQAGPLAGLQGGSWARGVLMLARTEGMVVKEPTKANYQVSSKPPPQPPQPFCDGAFGCHDDVSFLRVWQALAIRFARELIIMHDI